MNKKEFTVGQIVYVVNMSEGRNKDHEIWKTEIISAGRKYIYTAENRKYNLNTDCEKHYLTDCTLHGDTTLLFLTNEAAISHIRTMYLRTWLTRLNYINCESYTKEQLEQVYKILGGGE